MNAVDTEEETVSVVEGTIFVRAVEAITTAVDVADEATTPALSSATEGGDEATTISSLQQTMIATPTAVLQDTLPATIGFSTVDMGANSTIDQTPSSSTVAEDEEADEAEDTVACRTIIPLVVDHHHRISSIHMG